MVYRTAQRSTNIAHVYSAEEHGKYSASQIVPKAQDHLSLETD